MLALREKVERGIWAWLRASGAGGVLSLGLCLSQSEALAEPVQPRTEYFTGFEVSDNYASGYVGAGYAFGKAGYAAPGFRLRAVGAYGRYDYEGSLLFDGISQPTTFDGQDAFAAALIGYEFRPGRPLASITLVWLPELSLGARAKSLHDRAMVSRGQIPCPDQKAI